MTNPDFTYVPEPNAPILKTALAAQSSNQKSNDLAYAAACAAYRIRSGEPDPKLWKPLIELEPEDRRALVREYLTQAYRSMQRRAEVAEGGKRSDAGDAAISQLAKRYGVVADSAAKV